jgi:hypothetical protein
VPDRRRPPLPREGAEQPEETFECIATVGASGWDLLGQALTAAMQSNINDPGGCNNGFLRKDALLMVTFIATNPDEDLGRDAGRVGPGRDRREARRRQVGGDAQHLPPRPSGSPTTGSPRWPRCSRTITSRMSGRRLRAGVRRGREPRRDRVRRLHAAAGVKPGLLSCRCGRTRGGRRRRCPRRRPRRRARPPPRARSEAPACRSG